MAKLFKCPNCGGRLAFDPDNQDMKCESCRNEYQLEDIPSEDADMDTLVCPTCGGQIIASQFDGMEFCPYCGEQISNAEKFSGNDGQTPEYIIPFRFGKKQVLDEYQRATARVPFLPSELKSSDGVKHIVGMYIPYWIYQGSAVGEISVPVEKEEHEEDFDTITTITTTGQLHANIRLNPLTVGQEASRSLNDYASDRTEPFYYEDMRPFDPNYTAGFYAENASTDPDDYQEYADSASNDIIRQYIVDEVNNNDFYITAGSDSLHRKIKSIRQQDNVAGAYFPYWFVTTKRKNRVSYTMINGQTGSAYTELPIDKKRFTISAILLSLIIAAGIYFLIGTVELKTIAMISMAISALMIFCSIIQMTAIKEKEGSASFLAVLPSIITTLLSTGLLGLNFVSDTPYIIVLAVTIISAIWTGLRIIDNYNITASNPLPQFEEKRGGLNGRK